MDNRHYQLNDGDIVTACGLSLNRITPYPLQSADPERDTVNCPQCIAEAEKAGHHLLTDEE